jgi:hypothetical protein
MPVRKYTPPVRADLRPRFDDPAVLHEACRLKGLGLRVVPVLAGTKEPAFAGWPAPGCDPSPEKLAAHYRRHPGDGLAILTGLQPDGRYLVALDIDPRNGGDERRLRAKARVELPETAWATTPGGGKHLLFHSDLAIPGRQSILPGIDVIGDPGTLTVEPSRGEGGGYLWYKDPEAGIAGAPDGLVRWLRGGVGFARIPFGKYKGRKIHEVGADRDGLGYLAWLQGRLAGDEVLRAWHRAEIDAMLAADRGRLRGWTIPIGRHRGKTFGEVEDLWNTGGSPRGFDVRHRWDPDDPDPDQLLVRGAREVLGLLARDDRLQRSLDRYLAEHPEPPAARRRPTRAAAGARRGPRRGMTASELAQEMVAGHPLSRRGTRHEAMRTITLSYLGRGHDEQDVEAALLAWWEANERFIATPRAEAAVTIREMVCTTGRRLAAGKVGYAAGDPDAHVAAANPIELNPEQRAAIRPSHDVSRRRRAPGAAPPRKRVTLIQGDLCRTPEESRFVECLLVRAIYDRMLGREDRFTHNQCRAVARARFPDVDPFERPATFERLKCLYFDRPRDRKPATRVALFEELRKGNREDGESVYAPTPALEALLAM